MEYIDALRGIACLWVMIHHTFENHPLPSTGAERYLMAVLVAIANTGWLGVSLFLVLSGFCLYYPFVRKTELSEIHIDVREFALRRTRRILPPYYASLVFVQLHTMYTAYKHGSSLQDVWFNKVTLMSLFMLQNLSSAHFGGINGVTWSLALESQLYLIFPFLVFLMARRGLRLPLLITFAFSVMWQFFVWRNLGLSKAWTPELAAWYHAMPARCFEFVMGMVAAAMVARPRTKPINFLKITATLLVLPASVITLFVTRFGPFLDQTWGIIFACLLIVTSYVHGNVFTKHPLVKALVHMGTFSYSIYLIHLAIFDVWHIPASGLPMYVIAVIRILVVIGLGYLFFLVFERPFIGKQVTKAPENHAVGLNSVAAEGQGG